MISRIQFKIAFLHLTVCSLVSCYNLETAVAHIQHITRITTMFFQVSCLRGQSVFQECIVICCTRQTRTVKRFRIINLIQTSNPLAVTMSIIIGNIYRKFNCIIDDILNDLCFCFLHCTFHLTFIFYISGIVFIKNIPVYTSGNSWNLCFA